MGGHMAENLYIISNEIKLCALSWPIRWLIACKYDDITTSGIVRYYNLEISYIIFIFTLVIHMFSLLSR